MVLAKFKPDAAMKAIVQACYPNYKGRKFRVVAQERTLDVRSYWDGGSRNYYTFYCLATGAVVEMPAQSAFDKQLGGADRVTLPDGIICVERTYFCGKDLGITFHINPANMPANLLGN